MKKDMQNKEIMRINKNKSTVQSELSVDEQQYEIKHLQKKCDINYEDYVQEISATQIPMKMNKSGHLCV